MSKKKKKQRVKSKSTKPKLTPEQKERRRRLKASRARKKELAKLLRKKSRQRGPNPYSAIHFKDGFVYEPVRYTVLTSSQLPSDRIEMISARLKTVTTGPSALTLPDGSPGWSTTEIGTLGRAYIVAYCGVEVALFFKRQLTEIVPEPGEKVPEGVLQDPKEAWQRLDLLGRSAEKSNFVLTQSQRRLDEINMILRERVKTLDDLNDELIRKNENLIIKVDNLEDERLSLGKRYYDLLGKLTPKQKKSLKSKGNAGKQYSSKSVKHKKRH